LNKKDRVMKTLNHEEPDIVPITELAIDPVHIENLTQTKMVGDLPLQSEISFSDRRAEEKIVATTVLAYQKLGFELIPVELSAPDGWKTSRNPDGTVTDEWGRILSYDPNCKLWVPTGGSFTCSDDIAQFHFPDPHDPGRTFPIAETKKKIGDELALAGFIRDPFAYAWEMLPIADFVRCLYEQPDIIRRLIERVTDFNIEMIKQIIDAGADLVIDEGDYAEKRGPLVPVKFFRDTVLPNLQRQAEKAHKAGVKILKHSDGNLNPILDDLSNIVDGIHSIDPSAGMDIGEVKRRYGEKLVLIGNVSVDNLCTKTKEEVVQETKECLRKAAPGGGFILSSSNSWYTNAKLENCLAMVDTGRKYGQYPIAI
jgi:uroporphyrinogen decarboxylase